MDKADAESVLRGYVKRASFDNRNAANFCTNLSSAPIKSKHLFGNSVHKCWLGAPLNLRRSVQVGLKCCDASAQARAINLQVLHNTLNIIARLGDWNALHPIDCIDLGISPPQSCDMRFLAIESDVASI